MSPRPMNAYKWIKEGIGHNNAKRYKSVYTHVSETIQLDPDCVEAYYGKGFKL